MSKNEQQSFTFPDLKEKYLEYYEKNQVLTVFLTGMFLMMFICALCALFTNGTSFLGMLHPFPQYVFMDHFSMVVDSSFSPYTLNREIYPPLAIVIYATIGHFILPFMAGSYESSWELATLMRESEMPMMVYLVLIMAIIMSFYMLYQKFTEKDFNHNEYNAIFIAILFSYPVLFGLSTGNIIFFCVLCCVLYLYLYDSDKKWVRYLAYICLGCAAGVKVTPAFLAVLTLKRQGWTEFFKCFVIVTALLLVPFVFTDGDPITYFQNTLSYASSVPSTFGFLNIADIINALGIGIYGLLAIEVVILGIFMLLVLMDDEMERWEEATLLGAMLMLIFSVSVSYTLVYMIMGLFLLLTTHKTLDKGLWLCIICFVAILADFPGFWVGQTYIGSIKLVFLAVMVLYLMYKSVKRQLKSAKPVVFEKNNAKAHKKAADKKTKAKKSRS